MINQIKKVIDAYQMIQQGDKVLVGVSGGADSMCLLSVLMELSKEYGIGLAAVHVNHQLRGEEALKEEQYVEQFCRQAGLPFAALYADVAGTAAEKGWSLEEAGRNLRYQLFEETRIKLGCSKIAVAHHQEDAAETVLFYMFRGTGLNGMQGILPVRGNIIRPLIETSREEIECYLVKKGIFWFTDQSNFSDAYTRNKIRNHILAYAKQEINQGASRNIARLAGQMMEVHGFIKAETEKAYRDSVMEQDGSFSIDIDRFCGYHPVIRKELLVQVLGRKDTASVHIQALEGLFRQQSGSCIQLKNGVYARREFNKIVLKRLEIDTETVQKDVYIQIPGIFHLPWLDRTLKMDIIKYDVSMQIPKNNYTKWFDYDKIKSAIALRVRHPEDRIQINQAGGHKSIKALYVEQKVAYSQRNQVLLLAAGNSILWVPGIRSSEGYHVDAETRHVLTAEIV